MEDSVQQNKSCSRAMNPWLLHLQKLGLELKCPLCLNLFNRPLLLPCDHIFCNSCIPNAALTPSDCPICKAQYSNQDLRPLPFVENMTMIFRSLDAAFFANSLQSVCTDAGGVSIGIDSNEKLSKESSGQSMFSLMATKLPRVPVNRSVEDGVGKNEAWKPSLQLDMKVEQTLLDSPPSFGEMKGSDNYSNDQSPENYLSDRQGKRKFDVGIRQEKPDSSASGTEGHLRDSKRQKKLNYGPLETGVKSDAQIQQVLQPECLAMSNSELECRSGVPPAGTQLPAISDDSRANKTICGFCQSSSMSKATGPMLHYANGNQVEGERATRPNVIHVHSTCIDWAPQVYYAGETVKNLKAELARGAKLKCSGCGLKGAALGCYVKSCRKSYHVPCAQEISKCRWDYENFLVLCPAHASVKFPNEKSGNCFSKNHTMPPQITPQQSSLWVASPNEAKELVLCGSALSSEDKFLLVKFASMIGATVSKFWKPNVTHVIAATDVKGACTRTLKVLMAILNGRWILNIDWIKACMEAMRSVDEEPYEISLDNHGCCDGPKTGRIRALDNAPKLLDGLNFYFAGDFVSGYKEDLQNLVIAAGGIVFKSKEELVAQSCDEQAASSRTLVVYNLDPPQGSKVGEEVSILWQRLSEAEDLTTEIGGGQVIGHTWLLESIAAYKLQPFVS